MSAHVTELKQKVAKFRVTDLVHLLQYANVNRNGKKDDLLRKAYQLVERKATTSSFVRKITELSRLQDEELASAARPPPAHQNSVGMHQTNFHLMQQLANPPSVPAHGGKLDTAAAAAAAISSLIKVNGSTKTTTTTQSASTELRMQELPFYDIVDTIIKPTAISPRAGSKQQEHQLNFYLSAKQAHDVTLHRVMKPQGNGMWMCEYGVQVQLRLCPYDTSSVQADKYPSNIGARVNNKVGQLPTALPARRPNELPRRPGRPIDITPQCRLSPMVPNQINISWLYDVSQADTNPPLLDKKVHTYALSLWLVKALDAKTLLERLVNKGARHPLFSRRLIKEKLNREEDYGIELSSLRVSLQCPVSKMRMTTPVRCADCTHLQCFDASIYLQLNERKPTWKCPVCDKLAEYRHLFIDGLVQEILGEAPTETSEIEFQRDGSWRPVNESDEPQESAPETVSIEATPQPKKRHASPIKLETPAPVMKKTKVMEEEDFVIVLDSDDDSEAEQNSTPEPGPHDMDSGKSNSPGLLESPLQTFSKPRDPIVFSPEVINLD